MDRKVCYHGGEYTARRQILWARAYQRTLGTLPLTVPVSIQKLLIAFAFLLGLLGCSSSRGVPTALPQGNAINVTGAWEVDYKMTENAQEKLLFLYEIARSQISQEQRRREDPRALGRQGVERAIDDLNGLIKLGTLADSMNRTNVLRIEQGDDYVLVKRDDDFALTCELGRDKPEFGYGLEWCGFDKNGQLMYVSRLPEGLDIVHRFMLSDNGERLSVSTTVKTPALSDAYTINRVYMPFEEGGSLYNCEFTLEKKKTCWLGPSEQ